MEIADIVSYIATLAGGGLISAVFLAPQTKKKARAEADKMVSDNWREFADQMQNELSEVKNRLEKSEKALLDLREAIMTAYQCPHLREHPDAQCPVQNAYQATKED